MQYPPATCEKLIYRGFAEGMYNDFSIARSSNAFLISYLYLIQFKCLVITLKRFGNDLDKISTKCIFPELLNVGMFLLATEERLQPEAFYELVILLLNFIYIYIYFFCYFILIYIYLQAAVITHVGKDGTDYGTISGLINPFTCAPYCFLYGHYCSLYVFLICSLRVCVRW